MNPIFSKRIGVLVATALLAAVGCSSSSSSNNGGGGAVLGTFVGTVKSSTGAALAGVTVTPSPASAPVAVTDSSGKYSMPIPAGTYTLAFAGDNVQPATSAPTPVAMGQKVTVDQTLQASPLVVKVVLPAALLYGGPAGFNTTVSGITATATLNGQSADASGATWTIVEAYDNSAPPATVTPSPATGASTGFAIPDFETVRQGANLWLSTRYGTVGSPDDFDYIPAPDRDQLLSFGVQQVRAMSFKVVARVTTGGLSSTGSAIVSPVTIGNGGNTLPLGMMVVGNTPAATTYAWTLKYLPTNAAAGTAWGDPPAGVALQGATTKNPTLVPTVTGVYQLANGSDAPISFRVSTYHGVGTSDADPGDDGIACNSCHGPTAHGDFTLVQFAEWEKSPHANFNFADPQATPMSLFKFGLDGGEGTHYSESCISCHTVGYSKVPTAVNNGFDDVMAAQHWTFPTPPATFDATLANWNALPQGLQHRGSIQCENCHGPLEPTDHSSVAAIGYSLVSPTASMNAGVCLVCHDALTNHDKGPLWSASPHAQTDLVAEATVENRGTTAAHCGRCHAAEGFVVYVAQQQAGNPGNIAKPSCTEGTTNCVCGTPGVASTCFVNDTGYIAYLSGLGLNNATAHSQTCQTCHDPHSAEIRVDGDTQVTAAGFNVKNAGAGALCMVCHNTRIGAAIYSDSNLPKATWLAGHAPSQADIFAGRNAFFFGATAAQVTTPDVVPNESAHKVLSDTCVECHVKIIPADLRAQYNPANTNHTFRATTQVCDSCHGADIASVVTGQVDDKMTSLSNALGLLFRTKLNTGVDDMTGFALNSDGTISDTPIPGNHTPTDNKVSIAANSVQRVALSTLHGAPALIVTLNDSAGTVFGAQVISFMKGGVAAFGAVSNPAKTTDAALTADQVKAAKAFYNYLLVQGGSAEGIHNPSFVNGVLDATMTQVGTISAL